MCTQKGAAAHRRAADDDGVDLMQHPAQQRSVEAQDVGLTYDVGMIREHGGAAAAQQPLAYFAHGVGIVQMHDIRPLVQQLPRQRQAQRGGGNRGQTAGADHADAVLLDDGCPVSGRVRHQGGDGMSAAGLPFGEQLHMVLDAAEDGRIIFVDMENVHAGAPDNGSCDLRIGEILR